MSFSPRCTVSPRWFVSVTSIVTMPRSGFLVSRFDTTRMREVLGYIPTYTTEEAFSDFARSLVPGLVTNHPVAALEDLVTGALGVERG